MIVHLYNKQKDLPLSSTTIKRMVPFLLNELGFVTDEISLHFLSKEEMGQIHEDFFSDPSPTDCMSFPMDPPIQEKQNKEPHILGEIFICPKVAIEYAAKKNLDPYLETTLYIIHGLLHLLGYDDLDPISRKNMRKMEKVCLAHVKPFSLARNAKQTISS